jgi:hypothetical protein
MKGLIDLDDARCLIAGDESSAMDKLTVLNGVVVEGCDVGGAWMFTSHVGSVSEHTSIGAKVKWGTSTARAGQVTDSVFGGIVNSTWWLPLVKV